jgi:hypothetical protein
LLRQLLDERGPDYIPPASNLESRFDWILERHGLPPMRREVDSGGECWTGRVDRRAVDIPLVVEIQSDTYHSALIDAAADAQRIAALRDAGFVVVEVTDDAVWNTPTQVAERIRAARSEAQLLCAQSSA